MTVLIAIQKRIRASQILHRPAFSAEDENTPGANNGRISGCNANVINTV